MVETVPYRRAMMLSRNRYCKVIEQRDGWRATFSKRLALLCSAEPTLTNIAFPTTSHSFDYPTRLLSEHEIQRRWRSRLLLSRKVNLGNPVSDKRGRTTLLDIKRTR